MSTCHGRECDSPCPMSRVLTYSLTHAYAKCENRHLCSINYHFSKTKSFCFINQNPLDKLRYSLVFYQVSCVFVGSEFSGSHRRLCMPSDTFANFHLWIHMYNQEYRVFHPRGYLSLLAIPKTRIFHFHFLLCNRETHFGRCPILPSPPSNTKHSVDLPCTYNIPSNTKHSVDLYHALTLMSCNVSCINAMQSHCMYLMLYAQRMPRATIQNHTSC